MGLVKAGSLALLPPGSVSEAVLDGTPYAICNLEGGIHALSGTCPHACGPLGQGVLREHMIVCPWHEWAFDCRTGESPYDARIKVERFRVILKGDDILIDA